MFREMRKKERELTAQETADILKKGEYGVLSTICENGYPYGVPVSFVYINNNIYFHCAVEGQKHDNILQNDKVSFCMVGDTCILPEKFSTKFESVIVFGKAAEVFSEEKNTALIEILNKYSIDYLESGKVYIEKAADRTKVFRISIEHCSGKARR